MMDILGVLTFIAADELPDLRGVSSWFSDIIEQAILMIVIFLVTKYLVNMKIGSIIMSCVIAGVVYFVVRNWTVVSGWIEALMEQL